MFPDSEWRLWRIGWHRKYLEGVAVLKASGNLQVRKEDELSDLQVARRQQGCVDLVCDCSDIVGLDVWTCSNTREFAVIGVGED